MMNLLRRAAEDLFPGYFALVMATGALSIAVHLLGFPGVAKALLVFNLAAYATLWILVLTRLACFPGKLLADLVDHGRGPAIGGASWRERLWQYVEIPVGDVSLKK